MLESVDWKTVSAGLVVVDASGNKLNTIEGVQNLKRLEWIDVSDNPGLTTIPSGWT